MTRVILASASPRRRELLAALVEDFETVTSTVDEVLGADAVADAEALALAKAREVAARYPGAVVIGSDTIVTDGRRSYGKPEDAADALAMWRALRGMTHRVVTGVAIVGPEGKRVGHSVSDVELSALDDDAVQAYIDSGRPMDKAGAYAIQDADVPTVSRFEGCYCSVMGLPLWRLRAMLAAAGVSTRDPAASRPGCAACPERP
jgi:septum formation protein